MFSENRKSQTGKAFGAIAVCVSLLLGAGAASAATVIFGDSGNPAKATAVQDVDIQGTLYDVEFLYAVEAASPSVYGPLDGDYDFTTQDSAEAAVDAVNAALNAQNAAFIGDETSPVTTSVLSEVYAVGFERGPDALGVPQVQVILGSSIGDGNETWVSTLDSIIYNDNRTYAVFTTADGEPPPPPPDEPPPDEPPPDEPPPDEPPPEVAVELDGNGNVIRITNLLVEINRDPLLFQVDFVDSTGATIWGPNDENQDFRTEEQAQVAATAVIETLNAQASVPPGASLSGGPEFFIAADYERNPGSYVVVGASRGSEAWGGAGQSTVGENEEIIIADFTLTQEEEIDTVISSSNLPTSRSVQVGSIASGFGTTFNGGDRLAEECTISVGSPAEFQSIFNFQEVNEVNLPVGEPNANTDIPAGDFQGFVFWFTPDEVIDPPVEVELNYDCANTDPAPVFPGVNTFQLSATNEPVVDMISVLSVASNDGILDTGGNNGSNAFALAASNAGSDGRITVEAKWPAGLPLQVTVCQTDILGVCINPTIPDFIVTVDVGPFEAPLFSFFVTAFGEIPFDSANNRIEVEFKDADGVNRGSASIAVTTDNPFL